MSCKNTNKNGKLCSRKKNKDSDFCWQHAPKPLTSNIILNLLEGYDDIEKYLFLFLDEASRTCIHFTCKRYKSLTKIIVGKEILYKFIEEKGYLNILKWAISNKCEWNGKCKIAARYGHINILEYRLLKNKKDSLSKALISAATYDQLEVLKWIYKRVGSLPIGCPSAAAGGGHLETLKWLCDTCGHVGGDQTYINAISEGHLDVLKWLCKDGAANCGELEVAAFYGHINIIEYLLEFSGHSGMFVLYEGTCRSAAAGGQLETLKWLRSKGCEWDKYTCLEAALKHQYDVLLWAYDQGCEFNACPEPMNAACKCAIDFDNFEMLKWIIDKTGYYDYYYLCRVCKKFIANEEYFDEYILKVVEMLKWILEKAILESKHPNHTDPTWNPKLINERQIEFYKEIIKMWDNMENREDIIEWIEEFDCDEDSDSCAEFYTDDEFYDSSDDFEE